MKNAKSYRAKKLANLVLSGLLLSGMPFGFASVGYAEDVHDKNIEVISDTSDAQYGGHVTDAGGGNAYNNTLTVKSGITLDANAYGGSVGNDYTYLNGNAYNNTLTITDGSTITQHVYGGFASLDNAYSNKLKIENNSVVTWNAMGGYADGANAKANSNEVTITSSTVGAEVAGGMVGFTGEANNNKVMIANSTIGEQNSGAGFSYEGVKGGFMYNDGKANGNTVTVTDSQVEQRIYGGHVIGRSGDPTIPITAQNNEVTIANGSKCKGDVYGGLATFMDWRYDTPDYSPPIAPIADSNAVNLVGIGDNYVLHKDGTVERFQNTKASTIDGIVYGGCIGKFASLQATVLEYLDGGTNNTINVYGQGTTVGNIGGVQNLNFYIQEGLKYGDTMLNITSTGDGGAKPLGKVDLTKTDVKAEIQATVQGGNNGTITLIDAPHTTISEPKSKTAKVQEGKTLTFDGEIKLEDNNHKLNLVVKNLSDNANAQSLAETATEAAATVNSGADFMMNQAMAQASGAADASGGGAAPFAAMGGNSLKQNTGSHVDSKGWNGVIGVAKKVKDTTYGVALEHSWGNYDSYLDNGAHASGDVKATGGALFAEHKAKNGAHYEGLLRAGRVSTDYRSDDDLRYDRDSNYWGIGIGGGYEFKVGKNDILDVYGRLLYSSTAGGDVTPCTSKGPDNRTSFDAVSSTRSLIGVRYKKNIDDQNQIYAGVAWQHEFQGDAKATIYSNLTGQGYSVPAPTLKGDSGMVELGYKVKASSDLDIELNVSGWFGRQQGITGSAGFKWYF